MKTRIVQIEFNDWIAPACFPSPEQQFPAEQVITRLTHWMGSGSVFLQCALYLLPPGDTHLIPIQSTYSFYIHLKLWHHFGPFQEMVSYGKHYDPQHFWLLSLYQVCFQPVAHQPTQFQPVTHHQPTINALSSFHWSFGPVASQASEYYQVFSRTNHFFHLQLSPPGAWTHNRPHPTRCIGRQYARWSSEDKSERWRLTKKMIRHVCRCLLHRQIWGEGINFTF